MEKFNEAAIPEPLYHRLTEMGLITPTPIQVKAIPPALEGKDILGSAQTGTGKTAAFGIPLVAHLMKGPRGAALVLLPTREIAMQVMQQLSKFIGSSRIQTALLIGGESMQKQINKLNNNPRLIVGTPGRINDHLGRGTLKLFNTDFLVLDEVDRMLDMGFGVQLDAISRFLTAKRQTLMFSATLPSNIKNLSAKYLDNPVRISVGATHKPIANIKQEHIKVHDADKYDLLQDELNKREGSVLLFIKTKHGADRMAANLRKAGHQAEALHGDLRQNKRTSVINGFRKMAFRILVATDVAARGLDIPHIEHVINYDLPQNPEDYIHRIGRTARAGAEGHAVNFLSSTDRIKWRAIEKLLDPSATPFDLGGGAKHKPKQHKKSYGARNGKPSNKSDSRKGDGGGRGKPDARKRSGGKSGGKPAGKTGGKPSGARHGSRSKSKASRAPS